MSRPLLLTFIALSLAGAALFGRLGVWQLSRHAERKAHNALQSGRLDSAEVAFAQLPRDPALARFRRVTVTGRWDGAHEVILAGRSRAGSPGAHLLTPLRVPGSDTAVLVNRGWAYAPDGAAVDQPRWRVRDSGLVTVRGFVAALPPRLPKATDPGTLPVARWIEPPAIAAWTGYPVHAFQLVQVGDTAGPQDSLPSRVPPAPLDAGPHMGYAFQWFTFMTIALVGVPIFLLSRGREAEKARRVPKAPELPT